VLRKSSSSSTTKIVRVAIIECLCDMLLRSCNTRLARKIEGPHSDFTGNHGKITVA
jgi:hypothetical protein